MQTLHPLGGLAELAPIRQWIPVKLVPLPTGKTEKLPLDYRTGKLPPKGNEGAHDPAIWTDYATAAATAATRGPQFTEGLVLTDADNLFVVDIDDALQADNTWPQAVLDLIAALPGCVVELSQSGRGLHVWGRGTVPAHCGGNVPLPPSSASAALYSRRRFIAIGTQQTGTLAPECPTIADVVARYFPPKPKYETPDDGPRADWRGPPDTPEGDDDLICRALQSRSAASVFGGGKATFSDLWTANEAALARAYPSARDTYNRSSADAALATHLAFWCGAHVSRIERLMRRSALVRSKWDDRDDYLVERTITNACRMQRDVLQDKPPPEALTYDAAVRQLRDLGDAAAIAAQWVPLALGMTPADV